MPDGGKFGALAVFWLALGIGLLGAVGVGVALWVWFGWPAAMAFGGVLTMAGAWAILQAEA